MSASQYRGQVKRKRKQRIDAEKKAGECRTKESKKRAEAAKARQAAAKTKSTTTAKSKRCGRRSSPAPGGSPPVRSPSHSAPPTTPPQPRVRAGRRSRSAGCGSPHRDLGHRASRVLTSRDVWCAAVIDPPASIASNAATKARTGLFVSIGTAALATVRAKASGSEVTATGGKPGRVSHRSV